MLFDISYLVSIEVCNVSPSFIFFDKLRVVFECSQFLLNFDSFRDNQILPQIIKMKLQTLGNVRGIQMANSRLFLDEVLANSVEVKKRFMN